MAKWTQNGNVIILTVQSDWGSKTVRSAAILQTYYFTSVFRLSFFWLLAVAILRSVIFLDEFAVKQQGQEKSFCEQSIPVTQCRLLY